MDAKLLRWGGASGDVLFGHLAGLTPSLNNLGELWGMGDSGFKCDSWIKEVVGVCAVDWLLCL